MITFEYQLVELDLEQSYRWTDPEAILNSLGKEGWRLVSVISFGRAIACFFIKEING